MKAEISGVHELTDLIVDRLNHLDECVDALKISHAEQRGMIRVGQWSIGTLLSLGMLLEGWLHHVAH